MLIEWRVRKARVDLKDVDSESAPLDAQSLAEPRDREFARGVLGSSRQTAAGNDRAHVDEHRTLATAQERQCRPADLRQSKDVDFKDLAEHIVIVSFKQAGRANSRVLTTRSSALK